MYSHTLCLGEWFIRSTKNKNRMSKSIEIELSQRNKRFDSFREDRDFLVEFLTSPNKLPSHYFQSFAQGHTKSNAKNITKRLCQW